MTLLRQTRFVDRLEAGNRLAETLSSLRGQHPLVLAIPRGGVPIGRVIADALDGDLDVVLVRKIGAPGHEEFAVGAIDESGLVQVADYAADVGADERYIEREAALQLERIYQRRQLYSPYRASLDPKGRVVIVVDDGLATGATMRAALVAARRREPLRLICAVPVGSPRSLTTLQGIADDVVCLLAPEDFRAVAQFYEAFPPVEDREVIDLLKRRHPAAPAEAVSQAMQFSVDGLTLEGGLHIPAHARGLVVFAHGSGSSRWSVRNRHVASVLQQHGMATLLFDLLSPQEDEVTSERFDVLKLARRLATVVQILKRTTQLEHLPIGLFGASTGAAASMMMAAEHPDLIRAIVSRGGRPDLAGRERLTLVRAPTLFIVGGADTPVIDVNRAAMAAMRAHAELTLVPGATHLFEEPGALERVAALATSWFSRWL